MRLYAERTCVISKNSSTQLQLYVSVCTPENIRKQSYRLFDEVLFQARLRVYRVYAEHGRTSRTRWRAHALTSTRCCSHRETTRVRTHQQRLRLSDVSNAVPSSPAAQIDERQHNNGAPSTRTCIWWILMLVDRTVRFLCQDASSSLPCIPINLARSVGISTSNSQRLSGVVPLVKEDNGGHGSAFGSRATACRLLSFLCKFRLSRYACVDQELSPRLALFAACPRSSEI
jgi:hypothetical protein